MTDNAVVSDDSLRPDEVGDRIAYAQPIGSYSTERLMPAERAVKIPDNIDYKIAAAMMNIQIENEGHV